MIVARRSGQIQSRAAGHADRGDHPDAGRAGEPADAAAVVQNQTGAEKADALHDVRRHLPLIRDCYRRPALREQREESRAHADEQIGAYTGGLALHFALQARSIRPAEQANSRRPTAPFTTTICSQPVEAERLRESVPTCSHGCSLPDAITARSVV